jgi:enoyl-CoA hydratase/carnithine racemase
VAGADIRMLEKCKTAEEAARISRDAKIYFEKLEKSQKPVCNLELIWNSVDDH